jgi:phosphoadenosine phosphosulfate reductase
MNTLFGKLEDLAIERLKTFEPVALSMHPDGYYLAYSGGKDSDVILHLTKKAGVKFTAHHHLTT